MTFTVQFTRFFEEFGCEDVDTKEFDNLKDAWNYYITIKDSDSNAKLYAGKDRIN